MTRKTWRTALGAGAAAALIAAAAGCPKNVHTLIDFQNYVPKAVQVKVTALDTQQNIVAAPSVIVGAAQYVPNPDGGVQTEPDGTPKLIPGVPDGGALQFDVEKKGRIKYEYQPVGTTSSMPLPEDNIPDDPGKPFPVKKLIPTMQSFDSVGTYRELESIAEQMGAKGQPLVGRLVDYIPRLSAAIIVDGQQKILDLVQLATPPEIKFSAPFTITRSVYMNKDLVSNIKVAVPIYGSIESSFKDSGLYKATVDVKHFPYENPFELTTSILAADDAKLKALKAIIDTNSGCKVRVIRGFRLIESAVFALQRGAKMQAGGNLAVASVLTADAVYNFSSGDESVTSLTQAVINVDYSEWPCTSVSTLIGDKLAGKPTGNKATDLTNSAHNVKPPADFTEAVRTFRRVR